MRRSREDQTGTTPEQDKILEDWFGPKATLSEKRKMAADRLKICNFSSKKGKFK